MAIKFIYGITDSNPVGDIFPSFVYEEDVCDNVRQYGLCMDEECEGSHD